ncbi:hypothetical protein LEP1GSC188_0040 [Leptospira weilii serovar Topaz str. LT2116]|uniref:Uncharacterized protein n=1 Tax=Leptospira weilii serovar Topaz str. LT2116 TaxID=1088540 RepID=M3GRD0_9LEPT|nr:hypothetical protein LEP1GSC188_0040 [Leptospira weilii serovar Topaz str. LT2116]
MRDRTLQLDLPDKVNWSFGTRCKYLNRNKDRSVAPSLRTFCKRSASRVGRITALNDSFEK